MTIFFSLSNRLNSVTKKTLNGHTYECRGPLSLVDQWERKKKKKKEKQSFLFDLKSFKKRVKSETTMNSEKNFLFVSREKRWKIEYKEIIK